MNQLTELEAILFIVGEEGVDVRRLSDLLEIDEETVLLLVKSLAKKYQQDERSALHILEAGNHFVLTTKKEMAPLLKKYVQTSSSTLSQAAIETLAIIAYKQPITRLEVEQIRGVQVSGPIQRLVISKLIEEKGRIEGPGRPILYGTTDYFLDYFGLKSLKELPDIEKMEIAMEEDAPLDLFYDRLDEGEE